MSARPVLRLKHPLKAPAAPQNPPLVQREMPALDAPLFYFCWVSGRRAPKHRHGTLESAQRELERLRSVLPAQMIYLFCAQRIDDALQLTSPPSENQEPRTL